MDESIAGSLVAVLRRLRIALRQLPTQQLVELRHAHDGPLPGPVFWFVAERCLGASMLRNGRGDRADRWRTIVSGMAHTVGLRSIALPLGVALVAARTREERVVRLLRADGGRLDQGVRETVHQFCLREVNTDWHDLAELVLGAGASDSEPVRRRIAQQYFRAQERNRSGLRVAS